MLLEELTLNNFCLYKGQQTFELAPARKNGGARPIVLCGGINGGGKTTLLDAIQLALDGTRARCSKRAALAYDDFLRECIHRSVLLDARLAKRMVADEDRGELEELETQIAEADAELKRLTTDRASLEIDVQRAEHEARTAEARFANVGGEHWQEHEQRKARKKVLKARQDEKLEAELVELATGELPLAMVADLRAETHSPRCRQGVLRSRRISARNSSSSSASSAQAPKRPRSVAGTCT